MCLQAVCIGWSRKRCVFPEGVPRLSMSFRIGPLETRVNVAEESFWSTATTCGFLTASILTLFRGSPFQRPRRSTRSSCVAKGLHNVPVTTASRNNVVITNAPRAPLNVEPQSDDFTPTADWKRCLSPRASGCLKVHFNICLTTPSCSIIATACPLVQLAPLSIDGSLAGPKMLHRGTPATCLIAQPILRYVSARGL